MPVAIGLAAGALTYFTADRLVETKIPGAGAALALGALLDGIPEQAVLGIGLARARRSAISLLAAIFVSNLPEAIGASTDLREAGRSTRHDPLLWLRRRRRLHARHASAASRSPTPPAATSTPPSTASPPVPCS